jgi:zona occludens toxin (predicted ATPase)
MICVTKRDKQKKIILHQFTREQILITINTINIINNQYTILKFDRQNMIMKNNYTSLLTKKILSKTFSKSKNV